MRYTLLGAAVLAVGLVGGCASTQPKVVVAKLPSGRVAFLQSPVNPNSSHAVGRFSAETNITMDRIGERLRADVARGRTMPSAMDEYNRQRASVAALVSTYSGDGYIQDGERAHVRRILDNMDDLKDRYRYGRGGGPQ